jgi:hypothetical protein
MSKLRYRSNEADGASAVAHEFDTGESFVTDGAKVLIFKNNGVEKAAVDKDGVMVATDHIITVNPIEGGAGIQAALDAFSAAGHGGIIQLIEGTYDVSDEIADDVIPVSDVTIQGIGDATVINWTGSTDGPFYRPGYYRVSTKILDPTNVGDTSIYTTTDAEAGDFLAGYRVSIWGMTADGFYSSEYAYVKSDGIPGTGEIELVSPINTAFTSDIYIQGWQGGVGNILRNLKIVDNGTSTGAMVRYNRQENGLIENVSIESDGNNAFYGITVSASTEMLIRNCQVRSIQASCYSLGDVTCSTLENCVAENAVVGSGSNGVSLSKTTDCVVRNCRVENAYRGIFGGGDWHRRLKVVGNTVRRVTSDCPINIYRCADTMILNNVVENGVSHGLIYGDPASGNKPFNNIVSGNVVKYCAGKGILGHPLAQSRTVISGNVIVECGHGIDLNDETDTVVVGNVLQEIGSAPIYAGGNRDMMVIAGNVIQNYGTVGGWPGIMIDPCDLGVIQGNIVQGGPGGGAEGIAIRRLANPDATNFIVFANMCNGEDIDHGDDPGAGNLFGFNKE